ncbi:hypothetical protein JCM6882_003950 [Rhodosporidiobolus microsporus]
MSTSTRSKRIKLTHNAIQVPPESVKKLLSKQSPSSLAQLALVWLNETPRADGRSADSDEEDDFAFDGELEGKRGRRALYEELRDEEVSGAKARVIQAIQEDWRDGLSYRQVAQLDLQYFKDKGTGRSWTAFQANLTSPSASITSSGQLSERFSAAFSAYHPHYLHLATLPAPHALTILRIQLLPSSTASSTLAPSHPPAIYLLHLPLTPYLLLPSSLSSTYAPIVRQCLAASISTPQAEGLEEIQLRGKDWKGLREVLLKRGSNVGQWRALREGRREADGGGVLVPKEQRHKRAKPGTENDPNALPPTIAEKREMRKKQKRDEEVGEVFGATAEAGEEGAMPVLERLDFTVDLPYPTLPPFSAPSAAHPPLLLRFEGAHVLSGLRSLVSHGLTEGEKRAGTAQAPGLPRWLGETVLEEGVNRVKVGRRKDGTVGRV